MSQAHTRGRALDQARNISQNEAEFIPAARLTDSNHAQVRRKGGKGIVCNFWLRGSNDGEEGRFASVGISHQANIGDETQFEQKPSLLTRLTILRFMRRLVGRCREMYIAQTATSPARHHDALVLINKVGDQFLRLGITYNRAAGYLQHNILAFRTVHFLAGASTASLGLKVLAVSIIDQRIEIRGRLHVDAAASAAVAPVRSSEGCEFFAAEV